ncbi:hypothetical protein NEPAR04_2511 [Nematocida parisii]|nr:hypothetical protein NEPAR03_2387 [Nematocida parisii]KAI5131581.1 hypothetical protein NEPAR08_2512 [Nematocida parisii]KAI5145832.1 hypothetical protein NEPAR04_2511 [Nematocida parisii]
MMSICHHYISDIKLYKNENIEKIKKYLNELMSEERQIFNINNEIKKSKLYSGYSGINGFNTDNFKNNVINNYLSQ